jgi:hypothetical protein
VFEIGVGGIKEGKNKNNNIRQVHDELLKKQGQMKSKEEKGSSLFFNSMEG